MQHCTQPDCRHSSIYRKSDSKFDVVSGHWINCKCHWINVLKTGFCLGSFCFACVFSSFIFLNSGAIIWNKAQKVLQQVCRSARKFESEVKGYQLKNCVVNIDCFFCKETRNIFLIISHFFSQVLLTHLKVDAVVTKSCLFV